MIDRAFVIAALLAAAILVAPRAPAATPQATLPPAAAATGGDPSLAPLSASPAPRSSHAPFEVGDCKVCHRDNDARNPGPVIKKGAAMCLECHEDFADIMKRPHPHDPARSGCIKCHNPHNAAQPKLLKAESGTLCLDCHEEIDDDLKKASVKHRAVTTDGKCLNCHNPHASTVAKLLTRQPMDLCLGCHDNDRLKDAGGRKLQNIKAWLDTNKVWHEPVAKKDCSACHEAHGGMHFRLVKEAYPQTFYAPYDAKAYALCFSCHREAAYSTAQTTTLTGFRDGAKNLHTVHLQQGGKGRTCRACHEVHASTQDHHIRDGVPYGSSGWMLKLHYKKTADGGSCEKTCHQEKAYVRSK